MKKLITLIVIVFAVWGLYRLAENTHDPADYPEIATNSSSTQATSSTSSPDQNSDDSVYEADDYSFRYPSEFAVVESGDEFPEAARGYIPACGDGGGNFDVCAYYQAENLSETNFQTAGLSIRNRADIDSRDSCVAADGNYPVVENEHTEEIDGIEFMVFDVTEAATSHRAETRVYRGWVDGSCTEMAARISSTVYEVYPADEVSEFSEEMRTDVRQKLDDIVASLEFAS